jgi:hypothetical protein
MPAPVVKLIEDSWKAKSKTLPVRRSGNFSDGEASLPRFFWQMPVLPALSVS